MRNEARPPQPLAIYICSQISISYSQRASLVPSPLPDFISQLWRKLSCGENSAVEEFSSQLRDKIGSGLGTRLSKYMIKRQRYSGPFVLGEGSFFYLLGNDSKDIFTCILHTAADTNSFLSGGGTEATSHEN